LFKQIFSTGLDVNLIVDFLEIFTVNNIIDITNYVMLELGQPLHAFDLDRIHGDQIIVRRAFDGESITTLDGVDRLLQSTSLVIADSDHAIAVAGVMGGADSEMTDSTVNLLIESAHFHPLAVRRAARQLDMRTEASYRFERHVDPAGVLAAANRACELIHQIGAGEIVPGYVDVQASEPEIKTINLRVDRMTSMLGFAIDRMDAANALLRLGFGLEYMETGWNVTVPTWRQDIVREIDLIEEVGRVVGYEGIPERLPVGSTTQGRDSAWGQFAEIVRAALSGAGLQEIVGHTMLAPHDLDEVAGFGPRVAVRSALSADLSGLRRSLLPGLMDTLDRNARRGQSPLAFYEVGHIFACNQGEFIEKSSIAGLVCGPLADSGWNASMRTLPADFYTLSGIIDRLFGAIRSPRPRLLPGDDTRFHPGRQAKIVLNGKCLGIVGELHPRQTTGLRSKDRVLAFELDFEVLHQISKPVGGFSPLSPFQGVVRDVAPRVSKTVTFAEIEAVISALKIDLLRSIRLSDLFTGSPIPDGLQSLTLTLSFRAMDRTLSEEEVSHAMEQIRTALTDNCGASFVA